MCADTWVMAANDASNKLLAKLSFALFSTVDTTSISFGQHVKWAHGDHFGSHVALPQFKERTHIRQIRFGRQKAEEEKKKRLRFRWSRRKRRRRSALESISFESGLKAGSCHFKVRSSLECGSPNPDCGLCLISFLYLFGRWKSKIGQHSGREKNTKHFGVPNILFSCV